MAGLVGLGGGKAEGGEGFAHMGGQFGLQGQHGAGRVGETQAAGVKMQFGVETVHVALLDAVFRIPHDRRAQAGGMHAQLVGAAGLRGHRQPGEAFGDDVQRFVLGDRVGGVGVTQGRDRGAVAARAVYARDGAVYAAGFRGGDADGDGPVGFFDVPPSERGREAGGRTWRSRQEEQAGGVPVQAVDQAGAVFGAEAQGVEQAIYVVGDAGAALDRQAVGFVERNQGVVFVDDQALEVPGLRWVRLGGFANGVLVDGQRGDADGLAGGKARVGLGAGAVHADLAGAAELLQHALGEPGVVAAEPAVEADVCLVGA